MVDVDYEIDSRCTFEVGTEMADDQAGIQFWCDTIRHRRDNLKGQQLKVRWLLPLLSSCIRHAHNLGGGRDTHQISRRTLGNLGNH